jgi:NAD(P)H-hydrate repair Nnr-like enzyme with NAD(P)H-hydrate dehydratase domain
LADEFECVVVLKGSGTVIAAPGQTPAMNPTGNARLATAGTGDVLAGMLGATLARGLSPFQAAIEAVYRHGALADAWPHEVVLTAGLLAQARSVD